MNDQERAAFEAWADDQGHRLEKHDTGCYLDLRTEGAWWAWQARAALAAAPVRAECGNTPYDEGPFTIAPVQAVPDEFREAVGRLVLAAHNAAQSPGPTFLRMLGEKAHLVAAMLAAAIEAPVQAVPDEQLDRCAEHHATRVENPPMGLPQPPMLVMTFPQFRAAVRSLFAATPAAPQVPAVPPKLTLTGYQLREALKFLAPGGTEEQLEHELCLSLGSPKDDDGNPAPYGPVCWLAEYPEEGCMPLTGEPAAPSAPQPAEPAPLTALFNEAIAWGRVYGPEIPASQWDQMRDEQAAAFAARAAGVKEPT